MTRYLVTGGAGFIGSHLARRLVELGHETVVLDNLSTGRISNLDGYMDRLRFVEGSITDLDTVLECCRGVDCVFHQAALPSVPRSVADVSWRSDGLSVLMIGGPDDTGPKLQKLSGAAIER